MIDEEKDINPLPRFILPDELREEIEEIICSDGDYLDKTTQIRNIYEKYLYNLAPEAFDKYGKNNDAALAEELKGLVDIRAVGRALSDDVLRVLPQNDKWLPIELLNFALLVKPNAPMDLKNHDLSVATGNEDHNFSIWSRPWIEDPRTETGYNSVDYMGNYTFGYVGGGHFYGMDFDDAIIPAIGISGAIGTSKGGIKGGVLGGVLGGVSAKTIINELRKTSPDKTDAEIMSLAAAGFAQLWSDLGNKSEPIPEDIQKYFDSLANGDWGDNERDSEYASDGFDDFYKSIGLDKEEIINEERKLW